eukprot:Phypoly_transcript_07695.p1 GENE.Phypoly_transcript_07695~~Phypoly_transcript_07695.p1  ORF type:complete len:242 (+),score=18.31 Phypoly_transcript_07695:655-1380(+)
MVSRVKLYKQGKRTCDVGTEVCCQLKTKLYTLFSPSHSYILFLINLFSYIYDIMVSCVKLYKQGKRTCDVGTEVCCQLKSQFTNIWSLQSTSNLPNADFILSNNVNEVNQLIGSGDYVQICNPFSGPSVFCVNMLQGQDWSAPFIIFNQNYGGLTALYRCMVGNGHFFSTDPHCEGFTVQSVLSFIFFSFSSLLSPLLLLSFPISLSSFYVFSDKNRLRGTYRPLSLYGGKWSFFQHRPAL